MLVYATTTDLTTYTNPLPENATRLLEHASRLVRRATLTAVYDVDTTGAPTDADVAEAFKAATCTQVAAWAAAGIDPTAGAAGVALVATGKSIGGASITYAGADAQAAARQSVTDQLVPAAAAILADAALTGGRPWVVG